MLFWALLKIKPVNIDERHRPDRGDRPVNHAVFQAGAFILHHLQNVLAAMAAQHLRQHQLAEEEAEYKPRDAGDIDHESNLVYRNAA